LRVCHDWTPGLTVKHQLTQQDPVLIARCQQCGGPSRAILRRTGKRSDRGHVVRQEWKRWRPIGLQNAGGCRSDPPERRETSSSHGTAKANGPAAGQRTGTDKDDRNGDGKTSNRAATILRRAAAGNGRGGRSDRRQEAIKKGARKFRALCHRCQFQPPLEFQWTIWL